MEHIVHQAMNDHAATIPFRSQALKGSLALVAEESDPTIMRPEIVNARALADWTRELSNQLMGRVKSRLARYDVYVDVGLPSTANALLLAKESGGEQIRAAFRALTGRVIVVLQGDFAKHIV